MLALGIAWVVVTPYLVGLLVAYVHPLNRLVAHHLLIASTLGWCAIAVLCISVLMEAGTQALAVAPLAGLAFWIPSGGEEDDGDPPPDPPKDVPPSRVFEQPRMRSRGHAGPHVRPRGRSPLTRAH